MLEDHYVELIVVDDEDFFAIAGFSIYKTQVLRVDGRGFVEWFLAVYILLLLRRLIHLSSQQIRVEFNWKQVILRLHLIAQLLLGIISIEVVVSITQNKYIWLAVVVMRYSAAPLLFIEIKRARILVFFCIWGYLSILFIVGCTCIPIQDHESEPWTISILWAYAYTRAVGRPQPKTQHMRNYQS